MADRDGDGVNDADDAAPDDLAEFALDADGDGFFAICNAGQLRAIGRGGATQWLRNFELVADIDLSGQPIEPIGNCGLANNCMISRDRYAYAAHFDGNGQTIRGLRLSRPEAGGVGLFGFLGIASTVLADEGKRLIYVSETGNVIKQYDLAKDRQLPDLAVFDKDPAMPMVIVMNLRPDGELLVSNAAGFARIDPRDGKVKRVYKLDHMGWVAVNSSADGQPAFVGNFWSGELVKVRLQDGVVVARTNVGQKESLSGVAQYPGR